MLQLDLLAVKAAGIIISLEHRFHARIEGHAYGGKGPGGGGGIAYINGILRDARAPQ